MRISSITKNAGKACNNRLYRHIRTFEKIVKNYFVIFDKIGVKYKLKPERYGNAKPEQVKYIGNIYTFYNSNRHPIEHWDDPTAPIDTTKMLDIKGAHDLIKRALAIIDEYYEVI